jgi:hypothetical protein
LDLRRGHRLAVDMQSGGAEWFPMLAGFLLRELDAGDVTCGGRCIGDQRLFGLDAGEVEDERQLAALDEVIVHHAQCGRYRYRFAFSNRRDCNSSVS